MLNPTEPNSFLEVMLLKLIVKLLELGLDQHLRSTQGPLLVREFFVAFVLKLKGLNDTQMMNGQLNPACMMDSMSERLSMSNNQRQHENVDDFKSKGSFYFYFCRHSWYLENHIRWTQNYVAILQKLF